jgi:hypothetical protein
MPRILSQARNFVETRHALSLRPAQRICYCCANLQDTRINLSWIVQVGLVQRNPTFQL